MLSPSPRAIIILSRIYDRNPILFIYPFPPLSLKQGCTAALELPRNGRKSCLLLLPYRNFCPALIPPPPPLSTSLTPLQCCFLFSSLHHCEMDGFVLWAFTGAISSSPLFFLPSSLFHKYSRLQVGLGKTGYFKFLIFHYNLTSIECRIGI